MQRHTSLIIILFIGCFGFMACGSGGGDPCQVKSDCKSGLMCCKTAGSGIATRGVCRASCLEPDASNDVAIDVGEPIEDASSDGGDAS